MQAGTGARNSVPSSSSPRSLVPMGHRHVFVVSLALLLVATTHAAGGHATQAAAAAAITQQVCTFTPSSLLTTNLARMHALHGYWLGFGKIDEP